MKGFLAGLGAGLIALVLVLLLRDPARSAPPRGGPGEASPAELSRRLETERTARAEAEKLLEESRRRADALQRQVDTLLASTPEPAAGTKPPPAPAPTPEAPTDAESAAKAARAKALMKMAIQVGKPLSDDVAAHLGLEPGQRALLDEALAAEGRGLYTALREIAAEDPSQKLPEQDGPATLIAALGKSLAELGKFNEIFKDEEIAAGRKNVYMDELFGASSPLVRIAERLDSIRGAMFTRVQPSLTPEQFGKFRELFERNFSFGGAQFSLPANVLPRKN